jgi:hypothetical protein
MTAIHWRDRLPDPTNRRGKDGELVRISWKCRRHVAKCRHDMTCRSNFGQMGPCCRHKIEDVAAVCVGLNQHLPDFPKCVCRNILWYGSTGAIVSVRMYLHTHRYYRTHMLSAHFCHVLPGRFVMFSKFVTFSNRLCNWCLQLALHICYLFGRFVHQPQPYFYLIQSNWRARLEEQPSVGQFIVKSWSILWNS